MGDLNRYSLYNPELNLMSETETSAASTPAVAYDYIWFNGKPVAQVDVATSTTHWTFTDHLGTPILQTNATGAIDWRAEYEPFGSVFTLRTGSTRHQPLRFPGQESDAVDGEREYNIFRWYRSGWGHYTSADPIGLQAGTNLYAYAGGNPVAYADPLGLISQNEIDRMNCCDLAREINRAFREMRRLQKNELNPGKQRGSPFSFWLNYSTHLLEWVKWQTRLNQLLQKYDKDNCHDDIGSARQFAGKPYPDFDWDEFKRRWRDNINRSLREGPGQPDAGAVPVFGGVPGGVLGFEFP